MTQQIVLRNSVDAWTSPTRVTSRFGDTILYAHSTANTYQFFARPQLPQGSVVISAKLVLTPRASTGGTGTVDVSLHNITTKFDPSTITWVNQPTIGTLIQTVTRPTWFNAGVKIEFNVTAKMQEVFDGGLWWGWRISSTEADASQTFDGANGLNPPELVIEYTTPPQAPIDLRPSTNEVVRAPKPTLSWTTPGSYTSMQKSLQVQVATNAAMTTGLYTSNEISSDASSYNLATAAPTFTALTSGQVRYWRVRIKNDYGTWSAYSAVAQFTYVDPQTLTITSPGTTSDPTPVISWTYGGSQGAWNLVIQESDPGLPYRQIYDTGYVYNTATSFELPPGLVSRIDRTYRAVLRVWDVGESVSTPGAPVYSEDDHTWVWVPTGATPPIEIQLADIYASRPGKWIRWRYTGATASKFIVMITVRGVTTTHHVDAAAAREGVTEWYRFGYWAPGRVDVTYKVLTVMASGATSVVADSPTLVRRLDHKMPWVVSLQNDGVSFCLVNADIDPGLSEISDLVSPVNGAPFLAVYAFNKFNGTASGRISNAALPGVLTGDQMIAAFLYIRQNPRVYFSWADQMIECYIYGTAFTTLPVADGSTDYLVSFNFVQV